jgi:Protein of unknown function (DUF642)
VVVTFQTQLFRKHLLCLRGGDYLLSLATAAGGDGFAGRVGAVQVDVRASDNTLLASQQFTNTSPGPLVGTNGFVRQFISFTSPSNGTSATLVITDISPNGGIAVDPAIDDVSVTLFPTSAMNLVVNGSFEAPVLQSGVGYVTTYGLAPWQTTDDCCFELWSNIGQPPGISHSADGDQNLEILAYATNATVSQTISTTAGKDYSFSFYHSPRPSGIGPGVNSTLSVLINSQVIATFFENGTGLTNFNWVRFRTNFTAVAGSTTIGFSDLAATAAGTHIDNVVVALLPLALTIRVSEVEICWETVTNKVYQVQYQSQLTTTNWINLGSAMLGNGTTECIRDSSPYGEPQRFYRVIAFP